MDSIKMTLSLTPKKVQKVVKTCQNLLKSHSTTLLELTRVIIHYTSSGTCKDSVKISSTTTNYVSKGKMNSYNIKHQVKNRINLVDRELEVLQWPNFFSIEPTNDYSTDASLTGWGSSLQRGSNIRTTLHINVLELLAIKLALFSFTNVKRVKAIHVQIDKAALSYLLKMEGTKNEQMIKVSKEIWHYLLNHNMSITAEYLPSVLNTVADRKSSEWLFHPKVFQAVSRLLGSSTIDLFASRLCHQLPQYTAWHPDPYSQGTDTMILNWNVGLPYAFPPFSMISRVLLKIKQECVRLLILIAPVWSNQPWYPKLLNLCVREPVLLTQEKEILIGPKNIIHPLMVEN